MYENLKGKSISFEGGEGTGKSTLIKNLVEVLTKENLNLVSTREPGGAKISEQIREVIVDKNNVDMCYQTEALLFAASRAQFISQVINPSLKENKTILIDRFVDSSLVYQGIGRGLGIDEVMRINQFATNGWLPDLTIVLDIDPKIGLKRISDNNRDTNRLDEQDLEFYNLVRNGYLELAKKYPKRIIVIDADRTSNEILDEVLHILKTL